MKDSELSKVILEISNMVGKCAKAIFTKEGLKRVPIEVDDEIKEVCRVQVKSTLWHIIELLNALHHLSVNDSIKHEIYFVCDVRKHIKDIIMEGVDVEIAYACSLLNQLCFDTRIAKDVLNDTELYTKIKNIAMTKTKTKESCDGNNLTKI